MTTLKEDINRLEDEAQKIVEKHFPIHQLSAVAIDKAIHDWLSFPAVYFLMGPDGPFYVGCSSRVGQRIASHISPSKQLPSEVLIIRTERWEDAYYLETLFIERLEPAMNIRRKEYGRNYIGKRQATALNKEFRRLLKEVR